MKSTLVPRSVTTHIDSPNEPQPHRAPGQANELSVLIGRIPVAHEFRPARGRVGARVDQLADWFWFAFAAVVFLGIPALGIVRNLIG